MTDQAAVGPRATRAAAKAGALLLVLAAPAVRAEVLSLHEVLAGADKALGILMAEADYASAEAEWLRAKAEKGWEVKVTAGYGSTREVIDESRTRTYDAIQTQVGLSYPLLGAYARQVREIEIASGALKQKEIRRDAALNVARLEIEDVYAAFWGAQESLELIDAFLAADGAGADAEAAVRKATSERRRLTRRREEARRRLEQLVGHRMPAFIASGVQLPAVPQVDAGRLAENHPQLAALRAEHDSTRRQLDDSVWWGVQASFDLTQGTMTEYDRGQAGNDLFAHFNISMPLRFYEAGAQERRRLRADMEVLALKLREKRDEVAIEAEDVHAGLRELHDEVESLTSRTQTLGRTLRRGDAEGRVRADYFLAALEEIDARTRYWRAHVEMRSYLVAGAAEPAPEPTGPATTDVGTRLSEPLRR
jgi:outer membrane protein TolC